MNPRNQFGVFSGFRIVLKEGFEVHGPLYPRGSVREGPAERQEVFLEIQGPHPLQEVDEVASFLLGLHPLAPRFVVVSTNDDAKQV